MGLLSRLTRKTKKESSITFEEYLGPGQKFFELCCGFNASGVSQTFGKTPASKIISAFRSGDVVLLELDKEQDDLQRKIILRDRKGRQFGYYPLAHSDPSYEDQELMKQLDAGVSLRATVEKTGIVKGTVIWWCELLMTLNIPYPEDEQEVYVSATGPTYHTDPACNKTIVCAVPISHAIRHFKRPCAKCCPPSNDIEK